MPKNPHTGFKRGTHLFVRMKDGTKFTDKFYDKGSGYVVFEHHGKVELKLIKSIGIKRLKSDV